MDEEQLKKEKRNLIILTIFTAIWIIIFIVGTAMDKNHMRNVSNNFNNALSNHSIILSNQSIIISNESLIIQHQKSLLNR